MTPIVHLKESSDLLEKSLKNLSGMQLMPKADLTVDGRLFQVVKFLKTLGKIDQTISWEQIAKCLNREIVIEVMSDPV